MSVWVCPRCDEVYDANDVDEDWAAQGCPVCIADTQGGN